MTEALNPLGNTNVPQGAAVKCQRTARGPIALTALISQSQASVVGLICGVPQQSRLAGGFGMCHLLGRKRHPELSAPVTDQLGTFGSNMSSVRPKIVHKLGSIWHRGSVSSLGVAMTTKIIKNHNSKDAAFSSIQLLNVREQQWQFLSPSLLFFFSAFLRLPSARPQLLTGLSCFMGDFFRQVLPVQYQESLVFECST